MKKIISLILSFTLFVVLLGGCTSNKSTQEVRKTVEQVNSENTGSTEKISIKVVAPSGAPTLSMIKMFKENPNFGEHVEVNYESLKSTDVLSSQLMSGEADIAVVPTNLAATLYNKGLPYKLAASNVWGVLYLASTEEIHSIENLKGKEVYTMGRGLTPDMVFRYILEENGIDPEKDVNLKYLTGGTELASSLIAGESQIALIPEPMLSNVLMKRKDVNVSLDIQEEWAEATGLSTSYPQASLIIKADIIENNPEFVEAFVKEFEASINWANENPADAGNYSEELQTDLNAKIVEKAIERINMKFVNSAEAKTAIETYLNVLFEYSPESVGGKLPDDNFYYKK